MKWYISTTLNDYSHSIPDISLVSSVIGPMALSLFLLQTSFILAILHSLALCQNPENGAAAAGLSPGNHEPENGTAVTPHGSGKGVSEEDRKAFQDFLRDFKKTYSEENGEFGRRLAVFAQTRRRVAKMQAEGMKWAGITQFADMSTEERKQMLMSGDAVTKMEDSASPDVARMPVIESRGRTKRQTPPSSFDYRTYGWVTPVKHQGSCGSCWAFSTVALMETVYLKYWNNLNDLSEQDLVDCATGNLGCDGGNVESALYYISQNRTTHEVYYPYQGVKQTCNRAISKNVMATRYFRLTNESSIAYFNYHNGPVSFIFTVKSDFFDYASGVYDASECSDTSATFEGWHYMVIVGFTPSYWIAKNSWGTGWGNAGYAYIARGKNLCRMNTQMLCAYGQLYGSKWALNRTYSMFYLMVILVLVVPAFSRIHPTPIDDIQTQASQGPAKRVPAKSTKNVKHHEHSDPSLDQTLDDTDDNTGSMICSYEDEDSPAVSSPGLDDDNESGSSDNES
ncbi:papain family cysteine protease domain-containing protein [Ditylenchus destructor]|uniref:Papain family cysteine protease domain-containing protein n=1 Tax=Ditylenchus destructor TaxID=166010 RepID=A0AAD4MGM7_9BILA|nr:papain family cysteine protease domain-containing protein [Ditylenchus destructor]